MKYILLPVIVSLLSLNQALAQYRGGSQDGYSFLQSNGSQNNLPGVYLGGTNDGHSRFNSSNLNVSPGIYFGGNDDGVAFLQAKGIQNLSPNIYSGGTEDGVSSFRARAVQNLSPGIYKGGTDDGFALALTQVQNTTPPIYLGGANDGYDMAAVKGFSNALPPIYLGGGNDGDAEDGYSFTVSLRQNATELPPIVRGDRTILLVQLTGNWFNDDAVLGWSIESKTGFDHFEMQRSVDGGKTFDAVGDVAISSGDGAYQEYRYTDVRAYNLPADFLLYRLKCVDKEGGFIYSAIVRLAKDKSEPVIVAYPNPTSGRFTLALLNVTNLTGYGYVLTNNEGKILKRAGIQESNTAFDLSGYSSATYHLFLYKEGKSIQHFTILLTQ